MKNTYEAPGFAVAGSVRDLTLGHKNGSSLDASFPVHTPKGMLTFS